MTGLLLSLPLLGLLTTGDAAAVDAQDSLQLALLLPTQANSLRERGIPEADIKVVLDSSKKAGLNAGDTSEIMRHGAQASENNGNIDNFGSFVQAKLDEGLRGRDLALAIRQEHQARGKGKAGEEKKGGGEGAGKSGKSTGGSSGGASKSGGKSGKSSGGSSGGASKSGGKSGKGGVR